MKIAQPEPRRRSALLSRAVTPTSSAGVPRNGGTIKFKVGITAPVEITDPSTAHLTLPAIVDRNFSFAPDMTHSVGIQSKRPLATSAPGLVARRSDSGLFRLTGSPTDRDLVRTRPTAPVDPHATL